MTHKKFMRRWRTKKFERFNYYILEKMSLLEKLAFVKDVYQVRKPVSADIESINAICNALAHAFFPENLKAHRTKQTFLPRKLVGPHYNVIDIFTFRASPPFL